MSKVVLDASAILAAHFREAGGETVRQVARAAVVSAVNHAEAISRLVRAGHSIQSAGALRGALGYAVLPFDEAQALECGRLQRFTHHLRLSLSDRACLALAKLSGYEVLTGDRAWSKLSIGVNIRAIR
jgi:PIN domain nuclease of toxin-antitoxin system